MSFSKSHLLNGCNDLLSGYQKQFTEQGLQVGFSSAQKASQLNGFFTSTGVKWILEGNDYAVIYTVFPFIAALLDHVIGCGHYLASATVHKLYTEIANQLLYTKHERGNRRIGEVFISKNIRRLKMLPKNIL